MKSVLSLLQAASLPRTLRERAPAGEPRPRNLRRPAGPAMCVSRACRGRPQSLSLPFRPKSKLRLWAGLAAMRDPPQAPLQLPGLPAVPGGPSAVATSLPSLLVTVQVPGLGHQPVLLQDTASPTAGATTCPGPRPLSPGPPLPPCQQDSLCPQRVSPVGLAPESPPVDTGLLPWALQAVGLPAVI